MDVWNSLRDLEGFTAQIIMGTETEIINRSQGSPWDRLMFWKLAISKLICLSIMAAGGSIVATLNGVEWNTFTGTQKFTAVVAVVMAVTSTVLAFLSDTMQKLSVKAESEKKAEEAKST